VQGTRQLRESLWRKDGLCLSGSRWFSMACPIVPRSTHRRSYSMTQETVAAAPCPTEHPHDEKWRPPRCQEARDLHPHPSHSGLVVYTIKTIYLVLGQAAARLHHSFIKGFDIETQALTSNPARPSRAFEWLGPRGLFRLTGKKSRYCRSERVSAAAK
jgi:hypothetical protein